MECVPMPTGSYPLQCSPYDVSVEAYNRVGASDPASKKLPTGNKRVLYSQSYNTCINTA